MAGLGHYFLKRFFSSVSGGSDGHYYQGWMPVRSVICSFLFLRQVNAGFISLAIVTATFATGRHHERLSKRFIVGVNKVKWAYIGSVKQL